MRGIEASRVDAGCACVALAGCDAQAAGGVAGTMGGPSQSIRHARRARGPAAQAAFPFWVPAWVSRVSPCSTEAAICAKSSESPRDRASSWRATSSSCSSSSLHATSPRPAIHRVAARVGQ